MSKDASQPFSCVFGTLDNFLEYLPKGSTRDDSVAFKDVFCPRVNALLTCFPSMVERIQKLVQVGSAVHTEGNVDIAHGISYR